MRYLLILFLFLMGCATAPQVIKPPLYRYRPDIKFNIENVIQTGVAVVDLKPVWIQVQSPAKLNLLQVSTCHRDDVEYTEDGWFKGAKSWANYLYSPSPIESGGFCPMYVQAVDSRGIAAWGYIAFKTIESLPATVYCNGKRIESKGVSACASRTGFEQGIEFKQITRAVFSETCQFNTKDNKYFSIKAMEGFCYATFEHNKQYHRMVLLGYSEVLLR